jgi:hypothetical protein
MFLNNLLKRKDKVNSNIDWIEQLRPIIKEFKEGNNEPLTPEEVATLSFIIRFKIDLDEGNISEDGLEDTYSFGPTIH